MSGRRMRQWGRLTEMLEVEGRNQNDDGSTRGELLGYRIFRPKVGGKGTRGSSRQLLWAIENWIQPYLNRVRQGIEYNAALHRPPAEPDWITDRGKGLVVPKLKHLYGDEWESQHQQALRKRRRERRARD